MLKAIRRERGCYGSGIWKLRQEYNSFDRTWLVISNEQREVQIHFKLILLTQSQRVL